jgi:uncharacterized membrane protein YhaH (DUF805 family)
MKAAVIDGLRRWKDYSGRSDRRQFWWFYLFFLVTPFICIAISLVFVQILVVLNLDSIAAISLIFSYLYLLLIPSVVAVAVRRMHDVGKSGWFILIPLYNFYLYVQPSFEKGRIPNWILAEKVSLGFVVILCLSLLSGDFQTNLVGIVFWGMIYVLLRRKNQKTPPKNELTEN